MDKCNQEDTINNIKKELDRLGKKVENMPKIEYILEELLKSSQQQAEINYNLNISINKLSTNLEYLNSQQKYTDQKISDMEQRIDENKSRGNINWIDKATDGINNSVESFSFKAFGIIGLLSFLWYIVSKVGIF